MKKFLFALLLPLFSAAVFAQQGEEEVEKDEDKPVYLGVSFNDILGKATKITDLMLYSDYKILKDENEENVYVAEINDEYVLVFFTDEDDYVKGVCEVSLFDNVIDILNDLQDFQKTEEISLPLVSFGISNVHYMIKKAVEDYLKEDDLTLHFEEDNTIISYSLSKTDNEEFKVFKTYMVKQLVK